MTAPPADGEPRTAAGRVLLLEQIDEITATVAGIRRLILGEWAEAAQPAPGLDDSEAVRLLRGLVEALEQPLPDDLAALLHGQNKAWADWYPSASIVNSPDGPDTGSVIIARIFTATEKARAYLAAIEEKA